MVQTVQLILRHPAKIRQHLMFIKQDISNSYLPVLTKLHKMYSYNISCIRHKWRAHTWPNPQHSSHQISYIIKLLVKYEIWGLHTSGNFEPPLSNLKTHVIQSINNRLQNYNTLNPFRSYVGPRQTVWFSSSAPMSEDVRHGFCCVCSPAVKACPMLFLM
jgi:hypothetical protein